MSQQLPTKNGPRAADRLAADQPAADAPVIPLAALRRHRWGTVVGVAGDDVLARRLAATGFWVGAAVERLGAGPFGDPMLFRLHGYRVALRRDEAVRVTVVEIVEEIGT